MKIPWERLAQLKKPVKIGILVGTIVILSAGFYFGLYSGLRSEITTLNEDIGKLEDNIRTYSKQAQQLKQFKQELQEAEMEFEFSKQFLPEKKEIPKLLRSVSDQGAKTGLNVLLFQPQKDVLKEFYAEIPFDIKLEGPYLNLTSFFYEIGQLERIVNIVDIDMTNPHFVDGEMLLTATCKGQTFRFLTPEEQIQVEEARKAAAKKAAKAKKRAQQ